MAARVYTHTIGFNFTNSAGQPPALKAAGGTSQVTVPGEMGWSKTVPNGQTKEIDRPVLAAHIKSLYLFSTQAVTIKTNSTGSPDNTIALAANIPVLWNTNYPTACPITVDVVKFYAINAGGIDADVECLLGVDDTV